MLWPWRFEVARYDLPASLHVMGQKPFENENKNPDTLSLLWGGEGTGVAATETAAPTPWHDGKEVGGLHAGNASWCEPFFFFNTRRGASPWSVPLNPRLGEPIRRSSRDLNYRFWTLA